MKNNMEEFLLESGILIRGHDLPLHYVVQGRRAFAKTVKKTNKLVTRLLIDKYLPDMVVAYRNNFIKCKALHTRRERLECRIREKETLLRRLHALKGQCVRVSDKDYCEKKIDRFIKTIDGMKNHELDKLNKEKLKKIKIKPSKLDSSTL